MTINKHLQKIVLIFLFMIGVLTLSHAQSNDKISSASPMLVSASINYSFFNTNIKISLPSSYSSDYGDDDYSKVIKKLKNYPNVEYAFYSQAPIKDQAYGIFQLIGYKFSDPAKVNSLQKFISSVTSNKNLLKKFINDTNTSGKKQFGKNYIKVANVHKVEVNQLNLLTWTQYIKSNHRISKIINFIFVYKNEILTGKFITLNSRYKLEKDFDYFVSHLQLLP